MQTQFPVEYGLKNMSCHSAIEGGTDDFNRLVLSQLWQHYIRMAMRLVTQALHPSP